MSSALRFPLLLSLRCLDAGVGVEGTSMEAETMILVAGVGRPENSVREGGEVRAEEGWSNCDFFGVIIAWLPESEEAALTVPAPRFGPFRGSTADTLRFTSAGIVVLTGCSLTLRFPRLN